MEIIRVSWRTLQWFSPLLTEDIREAFLIEQNMLILGAVKERCACGVLVCVLSGDVLYMKYLFVPAACRRQGVATALFSILTQNLKETNTTLSGFFGVTDETDALYCFFDSLPDFILRRQEDFFGFVTLNELKGLSLPAACAGKEFFALGSMGQKTLLQNLSDRADAYPAAMRAGRGNYLPSLCRYLTGREGLLAALFFRVLEDGHICMDAFYERKGFHDKFLSLLAYDIREISAKSDALKDGRLYLSASGEESLLLIDGLFPARCATEFVYEAVFTAQKQQSV